MLGKRWKNNQETIEKRRKALLGKPQPWNRGENSNFWKGGINEINQTRRKVLMRSLEYINWRRNVFERFDYTCLACGMKGGYLEADHIRPIAIYPELIFDVNNGQPLCKSCHKVKTKNDRKIISYHKKGRELPWGDAIVQMGHKTHRQQRLLLD